MGRKQRTFTAEFKAKVVLELLDGELELNQVASKYEILPKTLKDWKKQFKDNAVFAFDLSKATKEYKARIEELEAQNNELAKELGKTTVERNWAVKKLKSLDLSHKKSMIEVPKLDTDLSLSRQCRLLGVHKSTYYYTATPCYQSQHEIDMLHKIDEYYTEDPSYGHRRMKARLNQEGFQVGKKWVISAMKFMGIQAQYPKNKKNTTIADPEHKKYPYLLAGFRNKKGSVQPVGVNHIWSGDITYIRLKGGFAYLCAIIDWFTKKIVSWKISETIDISLTTKTLQEALSSHEKPVIFNSDQGSQYTSAKHTDILLKNNISVSMNGKGRSIDNVVIERFFRTLKQENVYKKAYQTINEARKGITEYIGYYNHGRLHSSIGYKTPNAAYNDLLLQKAA